MQVVSGWLLSCQPANNIKAVLIYWTLLVLVGIKPATQFPQNLDKNNLKNLFRMSILWPA